MLDLSREAAADDDLSPQAVSQGLYCEDPRRPGAGHREAMELARSAAALAAQTDLLSEHADTLLELAHVLAAAGRGLRGITKGLGPWRSTCTSARAICREPGASLRYLTQSAPT